MIQDQLNNLNEGRLLVMDYIIRHKEIVITI